MAQRTGVGATRDSAAAFATLHRLADTGHALACFAVAQMLHVGEGCSKDPAAALRYFDAAGRGGVAEGHFSAAALHAGGQGLPPNPTAAVASLRAAAAQGHAPAKYNLAMRLLRGGAEAGVQQDAQQALQLLGEAAAGGLPHAAHAAGAALLSGQAPLPRDPAAAAAWFERAASAGFVPSQVNLGLMYARGDGVPRSEELSRRWLEVAAPQSEHARQLLTELTRATRGSADA